MLLLTIVLIYDFKIFLVVAWEIGNYFILFDLQDVKKVVMGHSQILLIDLKLF